MSRGGCLIVIPARWHSQRLPGKPLRQLAGKPMIAWVVEAALQVRGASGVLVATDDEAIAAAARQAGALAVLTSSSLNNGTERLLAITASHPADGYVNLQGDEPLIHPADVEQLIAALAGTTADVVSLRHPISHEQALDPSRVKVVCGSQGQALYFSRSPVPHGAARLWQHIGIYGFRAAALERIRPLIATALESQEKLEQLRWLEAGLRIEMMTSAHQSLGVDTERDAEQVDQILRMRKIRALVCDVDGVLTDGRIWYGSEGEQLKAFHARDGLAIKLLMQQGIQVALVSGRDSSPLRRRICDLGIEHAVLGDADKVSACRRLSQWMAVEPERMAYVGDDTLDLPGMEWCGWSFAVADAPQAVQQAARLVLNTRGGEGAIREVADHLLRARGADAVLTEADAFRETGLQQSGSIQ